MVRDRGPQREGVGECPRSRASTPHAGKSPLELAWRSAQAPAPCLWVSVPLHAPRVGLGSPSLLESCFPQPPGRQGHTHCVLSPSPNRTSPQKQVSRPPRAPGQSSLLERHRPGSPPPLSSPFPWPGPVALHGPAFRPDSESLQIRSIGPAPSRSLGFSVVAVLA